MKHDCACDCPDSARQSQHDSSEAASARRSLGTAPPAVAWGAAAPEYYA